MRKTVLSTTRGTIRQIIWDFNNFFGVIRSPVKPSNDKHAIFVICLQVLNPIYGKTNALTYQSVVRNGLKLAGCQITVKGETRQIHNGSAVCRKGFLYILHHKNIIKAGSEVALEVPTQSSALIPEVRREAESDAQAQSCLKHDQKFL